MPKNTDGNNAPKTVGDGKGQRPIWEIAKENNEKPKVVNRRFNPNCLRVGVL